MKKLFAVLLALIMVCIISAYAEDETLDMEHDTALVFLNNDMEFNYTLTSYEMKEDFINAVYTTENGEIMALSLSTSGAVGYYEAATTELDVFSVAIIYDDEIYVSSCADYGVTDGSPCTIAISAYDNDGWYQGAVMGTLMSEDSGKTYELIMAFDFVVDENVVEAVPTEDAEEIIAADDEYFISNVAQVNIGGSVYEMDLFTSEIDDGIYAMFSMDGSDCIFAVGIDTEAVPGVYTCDDVDKEMFYCAFIDEESNFYYGGCSNNAEDTYGKCEVVIVAAGDNGLYQVAVIGEVIDEESGEVLEIAGFADFTIE